MTDPNRTLAGQKISDANTLRTFTAEHKHNLSLARQRVGQSEETKQKIRARLEETRKKRMEMLKHKQESNK